MTDESGNGKLHISIKAVIAVLAAGAISWGSWLTVESFHRATEGQFRAVEQKMDNYIRLDTSRYTSATAQRARIMAIQEMILKRLDARREKNATNK